MFSLLIVIVLSISLSIQELWNLSERIGDVGNKGLSKNQLSTLPTSKYATKVSHTL